LIHSRQVTDNKKQYFGGYFDNEEHAAMKVNLLCDKYEIKRKNPMINIEMDAIQQSVKNKTSKYTGVSWNKSNKNWKVELKHNKNHYFGGSFYNEEHAAMKVNLLCDKYEIERKNPEINKNAIQKKIKSKVHQYATENIVNETVKIEDENILDGFKDACENRFMHQSNDEERCVATEFQNSNAKRKRKQNSTINDDVKEVKDENELLQEIQQDYTKTQD